MQFRRQRTQRGAAFAATPILVFGLLACGPSGSVTSHTDAGGPSDGGPDALPPVIEWLDAGVPPIAPPVLTPCLEGWREVLPEGTGEEGDPVTCDPYPEAGPEECADGWAHFVGEAGCTPVGVPCPTGDFPEGLPSDQPVLYVLAGAAPGGDGSEGAPLSTIAEAMAVASPGTVIALGKGAYDEPVYMGTGVTLWGACAAETRVTASSPSSIVRGIVQVFGADTRLLNLRIGPANIVGLVAIGAEASVAVDGLLIEDTQNIGLVALQGGRVHGRTLHVSGTRADGVGQGGVGIYLYPESTAELTRVVLSRNREVGIVVSGVGASLVLSDAVVRNTQSRQSDGGGGRGMSVQTGAIAEVRRALFAGNRGLGVLASGAGTSVTLSELVVRDTAGRESDGSAGRGLGVQDGATAEVSRADFAGNRDIGVYAFDGGTSVVLSDVLVRDTKARASDGGGGRGLSVQMGATVDVSRAVFARNRDVGLLAFGAGTSVTLSDLVVRDTQGRESDGAFGRGMSVDQGAAAEVTGALFAGNRDLGIHASAAGTLVTLSDLVVRNTKGRESDGEGGGGMSVEGGAVAEVSRAIFAGNRGFGVIAATPGSVAQLTDLIITDTVEQLCAGTTCADRPFGVGLTSVLSATMATTRFLVTGSSLCGVFLAVEGELDLSEGLVSHSPVGVCLQVEDYTVLRLTDGVRYTDNGTNLDATHLPLPALREAVRQD